MFKMERVMPLDGFAGSFATSLETKAPTATSSDMVCFGGTQDECGRVGVDGGCDSTQRVCRGSGFRNKPLNSWTYVLSSSGNVGLHGA